MVETYGLAASPDQLNHGDSRLNGSQVTQVSGFRLDWDWVSLESDFTFS